MCYGQSIESASKVESDLMTYLVDLYRRLGDNIDAPRLILASVEHVIKVTQIG